MLYCHDSSNHSKFIEMEKLVLSIRLQRANASDQTSKVRQMSLLKDLMAYFLQRKSEDLNVPAEDW